MSLLSVNKKGKWVVGGVIAFALIATASTGLAAWVIGMQTGGDVTGNITVDTTVNDRSVSVAINPSDCDLKVYFGPDRYNPSAYVSADSEVNAQKVDLEFKVKGTVSWGDAVSVSDVSFDIVFSDAVLNSTLIDIPSGASVGEVTIGSGDAAETVSTKRYTLGNFTDTAGDRTETFEKTFAFDWKTNPCDWTADEYDAKDLKDALSDFANLQTPGVDTCKIYVNAVF